MDYIAALEAALGREAVKNYLPMQAGDVPATSADTTELDAWVGFKPATPVREGVARFVAWYRGFYGV
jgi:UDP-glucuronate 4-epimerase